MQQKVVATVPGKQRGVDSAARKYKATRRINKGQVKFYLSQFGDHQWELIIRKGEQPHLARFRELSKLIGPAFITFQAGKLAAGSQEEISGITGPEFEHRFDGMEQAPLLYLAAFRNCYGISCLRNHDYSA